MAKHLNLSPLTRLRQTGSILLTGGNSATGSTYRNDVWRSSDDGASWDLVTSTAAWTARRFHCMIVTTVSQLGALLARKLVTLRHGTQSGDVLVIGGYSGSYLNDVWRSTNSGATWTITEPFPTARDSHACLALQVCVGEGRAASKRRTAQFVVSTPSSQP